MSSNRDRLNRKIDLSKQQAVLQSKLETLAGTRKDLEEAIQKTCLTQGQITKGDASVSSVSAFFYGRASLPSLYDDLKTCVNLFDRYKKSVDDYSKSFEEFKSEVSRAKDSDPLAEKDEKIFQQVLVAEKEDEDTIYSAAESMQKVNVTTYNSRLQKMFADARDALIKYTTLKTAAKELDPGDSKKITKLSDDIRRLQVESHMEPPAADAKKVFGP